MFCLTECFKTASEIPEPLVSDRESWQYPSTTLTLQYVSDTWCQKQLWASPDSASPAMIPYSSTRLSNIMKKTTTGRFTGRDFRHPPRDFPSATAVGAASASVPSLSCKNNLLQTEPDLADMCGICRWLDRPKSFGLVSGEREPCTPGYTSSNPCTYYRYTSTAPKGKVRDQST